MEFHLTLFGIEKSSFLKKRFDDLNRNSHKKSHEKGSETNLPTVTSLIWVQIQEKIFIGSDEIVLKWWQINNLLRNATGQQLYDKIKHLSYCSSDIAIIIYNIQLPGDIAEIEKQYKTIRSIKDSSQLQIFFCPVPFDHSLSHKLQTLKKDYEQDKNATFLNSEQQIFSLIPLKAKEMLMDQRKMSKLQNSSMNCCCLI